MTERLIALGAPPDRILTCPRGIDLEVFAPGVPAGDRSDTVVSTRALERRYRTDVLIRAIALAREEIADVSAVLAGDGEAVEELRGLCERLGVGDSVEFPGRMANHELPRHLRAAAVYASAIQTDGVSASLLEAMACGRPVVASRLGGIREVVTSEESGLLVDPANADEFSAAIVRLLNNKPFAGRIGERGREIVREIYSWEAIAARHIEFYQKYLNK